MAASELRDPGMELTLWCGNKLQSLITYTYGCRHKKITQPVTLWMEPATT